MAFVADRARGLGALPCFHKKTLPKRVQKAGLLPRENGWNPRADARGDAPGVDQMAVRVYTRGWFQTRWTSARGAGRGDERAAGRAAREGSARSAVVPV